MLTRNKSNGLSQTRHAVVARRLLIGNTYFFVEANEMHTFDYSRVPWLTNSTEL